MKKIAITTDTNSGMFPNEADTIGLFVLPMPFVIDGEPKLDGIDFTRTEFYEKLKGTSTITTSQPSVGEVSEFWRNILKDYDQIVHIPTSSQLSASCATAQNLAKEEEFAGKVFVVDNLRISFALKQSAYDAVALRDKGLSAEEIAKELDARKLDYAFYFSLESMEYLKRGGRISPAVAAIGSMLKLRPVLRVHEGKLEKFALPRTLQKAKDTMKTATQKDLAEKFKNVDTSELAMYIAYGETTTETDVFKEELFKLFPNVPFVSQEPMSLSVACHTGPGTFAVGICRIVK
ncbi:MAG: DegV family protein [Clostridia bacterium]|nr:DegV family protein [Clostridia bacterium]